MAGWQEPKFSIFFDRLGKCYAVRYESLWQEKDNKKQKETNTTFIMFLEDIQKRTTNIWHILVEMV
jgi:hypothetical protein